MIEITQMKNYRRWTFSFSFVCLLAFLLMGASLHAYAGLFGFLGDSWEEEVLLHDGTKIVIKRSQSYGGRHEIGQSSPIKEYTVKFELPNSGRPIKWTSEYSEDAGRTNFNLLALHVLNDVPYVIAEPNLCYSYGKWGRPNPPYVIFKYNGNSWQRIPLDRLPLEFETINVSLDMPWDVRAGKANFDKGNFISAESIKRENGKYINCNNSSYCYPEYHSILRTPLKGNGCPVPSDAAARIIAPTIDGKPIYFNWWPLAIDWLKNKCPGCDLSPVE